MHFGVAVQEFVDSRRPHVEVGTAPIVKSGGGDLHRLPEWLDARVELFREVGEMEVDPSRRADSGTRRAEVLAKRPLPMRVESRERKIVRSPANGPVQQKGYLPDDEAKRRRVEGIRIVQRFLAPARRRPPDVLSRLR
jgi:hypothetical protein